LGRYKVEFSERAAKDYKKLPGNYKDLVDLALSRLAEGLVTDTKPVQGEKNIYRLRVGKYRVLFAVVGDTVLIVKIGPRGDVYK